MNRPLPVGVLLLMLLCLLLTAGASSSLAQATLTPPRVKLGIDVLRDNGFDILRGKKVGLIANPASVAGDLTRTVDLLHRSPAVQLVALFGPEHGVYGDVYAGDKVDDLTDPRTGLKVFSLYGRTRKPTAEMLNGLDAVIFDLQDIGARSYTYVSTLRDVLEACAEHNVMLIVLDRPNPLGGQRIEGGMVAPGFESFVSYIPTPYVHGMTAAELAILLRETYAPNYERLRVVRMQGWTREMVWADTGLPWTPTSPHVPTAESVAAYVATGIVGELGVLSNGVGYTLPFQIVGAPWVDGDQLADALNQHYDGPGHAYLTAAATRPAAARALRFPAPAARSPVGVFFQPVRFRPFYATHARTPCQGVHVRIDPKTPENLTEINFRLLQALDAPELLAQSKNRHRMFDQVVGSPEARELLQSGGDLRPLFQRWRQESERFRETRAPHLLY
ncbi:MAG: exo-beta-N-acetylmuramidase NamZ domain-containing protein [Tepidisphaerales bacterium]